MENYTIVELLPATAGQYLIRSLAEEKETIIEVGAVLPALQQLLSELTTNKVVLGEVELQQLLANGQSRLFLLKVGAEFAGMLTLCSYLAPTGRKQWIEDVVVDHRYRGRSLGKRLVEAAVAVARQNQGSQLLLTSRPSRMAANALYRSLGFEQRETNVYRMKFEDDSCL